jgi:hypothetical protein
MPTKSIFSTRLVVFFSLREIGFKNENLGKLFTIRRSGKSFMDCCGRGCCIISGEAHLRRDHEICPIK